MQYANNDTTADTTTTATARGRERERTFSFAKCSLRLTPVATLSDVAVMRVEVRALLVEREAAAGACRTRSARKGVWTKAKPGAVSNDRHIADTMRVIAVSYERCSQAVKVRDKTEC